MSEDEEEDAWASELEGKAAPSVGLSKDVLRKAMKLNPTLAAQGSTEELFSKINAAQPSIAGSGSAPRGAAAGGGVVRRVDFAASFRELQQKYAADRKRVQDEIAKLQKQLTEFAPKTLEKLVDLVIEIDPNLTSPQTQEILKTESAFLTEIRFSVRRVIDKKMNNK